MFFSIELIPWSRSSSPRKRPTTHSGHLLLRTIPCNGPKWNFGARTRWRRKTAACRWGRWARGLETRLPDGKIWSLPFLGLRQGGGRGAKFTIWQPWFQGLEPNDLTDMNLFFDAIWSSHRSSIWDHYMGWYEVKDDPNVLWVFFEDMKSDFRGGNSMEKKCGLRFKFRNHLSFGLRFHTHTGWPFSLFPRCCCHQNKSCVLV